MSKSKKKTSKKTLSSLSPVGLGLMLGEMELTMALSSEREVKRILVKGRRKRYFRLMDEFCRRDSIEPALFGIKRSTPVALMTDNQVDFLLDQVTRHGIPDDGDRRRLYDELILKANAGTIMEESGFLHHPV